MEDRSAHHNHFSRILNSLESLENNAKISSPFPDIAEEIEQLQRNVKNAYAWIDHHLQTYNNQVDLLAGLIDFQQKALHFKNAKELLAAASGFLEPRLDFADAFFYIKSGRGEIAKKILSTRTSRIPLYRQFLQSSDGLGQLSRHLRSKERGILVKDTGNSPFAQLSWNLLNARSVILLPLRIYKNLFGFALFTRRKDPFHARHLDTVNLLSGLLSLLFFQHIFFSKLKKRFSQHQHQRRNEVLDQLAKFSEVISGYLNDLLTVMVPNVSLLKTRLAAEHQAQRSLSNLEFSLNKATKLTRAFLNYNLRDLEQPKPRNFNKLIRHIVRRIREKTPRKVEFFLSLDDRIPVIPLFSKRLTQLLTIFIQNGLEALPEGGRLHLSTRLLTLPESGDAATTALSLPQGPYLEMVVEDNGKGIAPEQRKDIFKPFFTTKINNEYAGLGLFIAYQIVRDLGGDIRVDSVPGKFSRFAVYLPVREEALPPSPLRRSDAPCRGNILVVDDEFGIRSMLRELFEMHSYRVFTAAGGEEALQLFEEHPGKFDLVILDMVMPDASGRHILEEIKKRRGEQKVLVMSGYTPQAEQQALLQQGAAGVMLKPFHIQDILEKVKLVLNSNLRR